MENDPRLALQSAFQHLDTFSVPGVGTFKKSRFSAEIDPQSGKIKPPGEKFIHVSGEKHVKELKAFYKSHYQLNQAKTEELVGAVKLWLMRGLKGGGRIKLEGIGTMELTGGKVLKLEPEESLEGQGADFFGLQPVGMETEKKGIEAGKGALAAAAGLAAGAVAASGGGESKKKEGAKPKEKEKQEEARKSKEKANAGEKKEAEKTKEKEKPASKGKKSQPDLKKKEKAAVVTPVAERQVEPPVSTPPADEKKKRRGFGWIILALLLIGAAIAGYVWKDDVNHQLTQWGLIGGDDPDKPDGPVVTVDSNEAPADTSSQVLDTTEPVDSVYEEDLVLTVDEYPEDENNKPENEDSDVENDPNVGDYAVSEQFYLIVGSTHSSDDALRLARQVGGKIIKPRYKGNFYRIYIAKASNKDDVIAKMVAAKEKHPKSWIFWLGM